MTPSFPEFGHHGSSLINRDRLDDATHIIRCGVDSFVMSQKPCKVRRQTGEGNVEDDFGGNAGGQGSWRLVLGLNPLDESIGNRNEVLTGHFVEVG